MSNIGCILKFVSKTGFLIMLDTMAMAFFFRWFSKSFLLTVIYFNFFLSKVLNSHYKRNKKKAHTSETCHLGQEVLQQPSSLPCDNHCQGDDTGPLRLCQCTYQTCTEGKKSYSVHDSVLCRISSSHL